MKNGCDTVILAGTRSGKSLLFQALFIIKINIIVPVIMPILALMEDQLQSIKKQNTSIIVFMSDTIATNSQV